jgi:hypothetical protein
LLSSAGVQAQVITHLPPSRISQASTPDDDPPPPPPVPRWAPARQPVSPVQQSSDVKPAPPPQAAASPVVRTAADGPAAGGIVPPATTTRDAAWLMDDPMAPPNAIRPAVMQQPADLRAPATLEEPTEPHIRLEPPGPEVIFRRQTEAELMERMRQEALNQAKPERIEFPEEKPYLTKEPFRPRAFPTLRGTVEPNYTCYSRLGFEQKNFERYGWDLGVLTPLISAAAFYKDVLLIPYHLGTEPCRRYECNTGYCLPGDSVPLLLYPPQFSLTGTLLEGAAVAGVLLVFPG